MTQSNGPDPELLLSKMRGVLPPDGEREDRTETEALTGAGDDDPNDAGSDEGRE